MTKWECRIEKQGWVGIRVKDEDRVEVRVRVKARVGVREGLRLGLGPETKGYRHVIFISWILIVPLILALSLTLTLTLTLTLPLVLICYPNPDADPSPITIVALSLALNLVLTPTSARLSQTLSRKGCSFTWYLLTLTVNKGTFLLPRHTSSSLQLPILRETDGCRTTGGVRVRVRAGLDKQCKG